jgi:hypothetical protein
MQKSIAAESKVPEKETHDIAHHIEEDLQDGEH